MATDFLSCPGEINPSFSPSLVGLCQECLTVSDTSICAQSERTICCSPAQTDLIFITHKRASQFSFSCCFTIDVSASVLTCNLVLDSQNCIPGVSDSFFPHEANCCPPELLSLWYPQVILDWAKFCESYVMSYRSLTMAFLWTSFQSMKSWLLGRWITRRQHMSLMSDMELTMYYKYIWDTGSCLT